MPFASASMTNKMRQIYTRKPQETYKVGSSYFKFGCFPVLFPIS